MAKKDPLHTKLCDSLGIEYPIVAFTHCKDVAAAVINAGAFAVLGQTQSSPEQIEANIRWMREKVGDKKFGIDLVFPAAAPADITIDQIIANIPKAQSDYTEDVMKRNNLPPPKNRPNLYDLRWMSRDASLKQLEVVLDCNVPVIASGLGNPGFFVKAAHDKGLQVWGLVGRQRQAVKELEAGVDVIVAQGYDSGGHTGNVGTFSIIPQVKAVAGDKIVIGGGGITTGRHLAGAIALGASGVWTGTVWLPCRESDEPMYLKERVVASTCEDTSHSSCMSGFTMRVMKCKWHHEWERPEAPKPAPAPYQMLLYGKVQQSAMDWGGHNDFLTTASGQGVGFVTSMKPARQIVMDMVDEAYETFAEVYGEDD